MCLRGCGLYSLCHRWQKLHWVISLWSTPPLEPETAAHLLRHLWFLKTFKNNLSVLQVVQWDPWRNQILWFTQKNVISKSLIIWFWIICNHETRGLSSLKALPSLQHDLLESYVPYPTASKARSSLCLYHKVLRIFITAIWINASCYSRRDQTETSAEVQATGISQGVIGRHCDVLFGDWWTILFTEEKKMVAKLNKLPGHRTNCKNKCKENN